MLQVFQSDEDRDVIYKTKFHVNTLRHYLDYNYLQYVLLNHYYKITMKV